MRLPLHVLFAPGHSSVDPVATYSCFSGKGGIDPRPFSSLFVHSPKWPEVMFGHPL